MNLDFHVISDTHFYDDRLIKFLGRPKEYMEIIIENWQATVGPDDPILHQGDLVMPEHAEEFRRDIAPRLTGDKKLLEGNYDILGKDFYESCGFEVIEPFSVKKDDWTIRFDHYPPAGIDLVNELAVHGHIHNSQVDHTTRNHFNVCVEVRHYTPLFTGDFLDHAIFRASGVDVDRDFHPNDRSGDLHKDLRLAIAGKRNG